MLVLPGPEHDAGDAHGRVPGRRGGPSSGDAAGGGRAGAAPRAGAGGGGLDVVPEVEAPARCQLVAAVQGRRRRHDVAGPLPAHGEAALRRRRGGDGAAVREREGAAVVVRDGHRGRGGSEGQVEAAEVCPGVVVAGEAAGAAHRHLQRRSLSGTVEMVSAGHAVFFFFFCQFFLLRFPP
uniref:Uncharacterized protein n=1 Tax=Triticum urartu TaxID=4572 RepID=A0A8R7UUE8_TRIUA